MDGRGVLAGQWSLPIGFGVVGFENL